MTFYLLDTNAVSNLAAHPSGKIGTRIAAVGQSNVATSVIVSAEMAFGVELRDSPRLREQVERVLGSLTVLPLQEPADKHYGRLRAAFKKQGRPMGPNDLFIAAHALALEATLVTDDRAFLRVPGLKVENWLRPQPTAEDAG